MAKKELRREDVIEALRKIAFGKANHGVELMYLEKVTPQRVQRMGSFRRCRRSSGGRTERWR